MKYETLIGLEIHTELKTKSKMFCSCPSDFGGAPNSRVCPVCLGLPGAMPRLNGEAVKHAVAAACALGCRIEETSVFERKNYFYPDLPKGYQISALHHPFAREGGLDADGRFVRIHEMHLEEDAGKMIHEGGKTLLDFNRCGLPLIETVTEPDMRTSDEVLAFLNIFKGRLYALGISDMKIEEGSMRVDVNISLRKPGAPPGNRCEIKNISSFRSIRRAIAYEEKRQAALLDAGGRVDIETRRFDEATGETVFMRRKESTDDYRYYPEPNIPPLHISESFIREVRAAAPEFPDERERRYINELSLKRDDAHFLSERAELSALFEKCLALDSPLKETLFLLIQHAPYVAAERGCTMGQLGLAAEDITFIAKMLADGSLNRDGAKKVLAACADGQSAEVFINEHGLCVRISSEEIESAARRAISQSPEAVESYLGGKKKAAMSIVGRAMALLGGHADPALVRGAVFGIINKQGDK